MCAGAVAGYGEHADPMHIRPYVDLPEPVDESPAPPDLAPFARCGTDDTAELPALATEAAPGLERPAGAGMPGTGPHARPEQPDASPLPEGARQSAARGRSHRRRRRPGAAVLAAVGVVAALGGGVVTTQTLTDGDHGDRSLSADDRTVDDLPSEAPTEVAPSPTHHSHHDRHSSPAPTPTRASGSATPRADRDSGTHTDHGAAAPRTPSATASSPARDESRSPSGDGSADTGGSDGGHDRHRYPRQPSGSDQSHGQTLRAGDSGPEVAELQRRLKQAGFLPPDAPEDGYYDARLTQAVWDFQRANGVRGDDPGEYGVYTRRALEAQTYG